MSITAKVVVNSIVAASPDLKNVSFYADYADGANKEWAGSTPALALQMTVKNDVAEYFEMHKHYTLTFDPS